MKLSARLLTQGVWGIPETPAISRSYSGDEAYREARAKGRVRSVRRLREGRDFSFSANRREEGESSQSSGLIPSFRLRFPSAYNIPAGWTAAGADLQYLESAPDVFRRRGQVATPGLVYWSAPGANTGLVSNPGAGGLLIEKNTGWGARFLLARPPKNLSRPLFTVRWDRYQFQIADGQAAIMRLTDAWTQAKEDLYNAYKSLDEPTAIEQSAADDLEDEIYADRKSLRLPGGQEIYGQVWGIAFFPEEKGVLNVWFGQGDPDTDELTQIPHSEILEAARNGQSIEDMPLWQDSPLLMRNNAGLWFFQVGEPSFSVNSQLRLGSYQTGYLASSLPTMSFTTQKSEAAGTSVTVENVVINDYWSEIRAIWTSTSSKRCAVLYRFQGIIEAGDRTGGTATLFDSDEYTLGGASVIRDITPSFEGDMRRVQYSVEMSDPKGTTTQAFIIATNGQGYPGLENHVAELWAGIKGQAKTRLIKNGLISIGNRNDMGNATPNQVVEEVTKNTTSHTVIVCDQWFLLDEDLITEDPSLDGFTLGAALRKVLRGAGIPEVQLAGIATEKISVGGTVGDPGRVLPAATLGEAAAEKPGGDISRGDYVRYLIEHYGMGRSLWIDTDGVWQFGFRSTTIKAAFTSTDETSRHYILRPLDMPRDVSDYWNFFTAEGEGLYGRAVSAFWAIYAGFRLLGGQTDKRYIGRIKRHPTLRNKAWRTVADCLWAARSLAKKKGLPPRYISFESFWHQGLYPGDRVTVDGEVCQIERITGGSLRHDRMGFLCREIA